MTANETLTAQWYKAMDLRDQAYALKNAMHLANVGELTSELGLISNDIDAMARIADNATERIRRLIVASAN